MRKKEGTSQLGLGLTDSWIFGMLSVVTGATLLINGLTSARRPGYWPLIGQEWSPGHICMMMRPGQELVTIHQCFCHRSLGPEHEHFRGLRHLFYARHEPCLIAHRLSQYISVTSAGQHEHEYFRGLRHLFCFCPSHEISVNTFLPKTTSTELVRWPS